MQLKGEEENHELRSAPASAALGTLPSRRYRVEAEAEEVGGQRGPVLAPALNKPGKIIGGVVTVISQQRHLTPQPCVSPP
jgi:hypothetical protein